MMPFVDEPVEVALVPHLKRKVDEFFVRWLSDRETQQKLRETLKRLKNGENILENTIRYKKDVKSPRQQDSPTPPCSPTPAVKSPRSPRKTKSNRTTFKEKLSASSRDSINKQSTQSLDNIVRTPEIPRFYCPNGIKGDTNDEVKLQAVSSVFSTFKDEKAYPHQMGSIAKACGLPFYWKMTLFFAAGGEICGYITYSHFRDMWRKLILNFHDNVSRFVKLLAKKGNNFLQTDDFIPLIQDVVDSHPGLQFLHDAPEFHSRYVHTVVARIFYSVNRSWSGKITKNELRKSNLLQVIQLLEDEDDINQITDFFSYEHFYVIYCKFWELDTDHDLFIDRCDLARHNDHTLSSCIIDRVFSGAVSRGLQGGKMSYLEFVWFLLAEEDKRNPTSVEYWFRCMDLDGDGVLSLYELEYFYQEQMNRLENAGVETLPFGDCVCQMLDMVQPKTANSIRLSDLKNCKLTPLFFDTFFNLEKYLDHEQKDPFTALKDGDDEKQVSDWERYASCEYELLVADESTSCYDDAAAKASVASGGDSKFLANLLNDRDDDAKWAVDW